MGLNEFKRSRGDKTVSPHDQFTEQPDQHSVNFMLSVYVSSLDPLDAADEARKQVKSLEQHIQQSELNLELIGPAEVIDNEGSRIYTVPDDNIDTYWQNQSR